MKSLPNAAVALFLVAACAAPVGPDTSVSSDDPPMSASDPSDAEDGGTYALVAIDEVSFDARATITFGPAIRFGGMGPCNRWSADLLSTMPTFRIGPIVATEMACDDLVAEQTFLPDAGPDGGSDLP